MNRIDRLVGLLTMLQTSKYVAVESISEKFNISIRTAYRDLRSLGEIGVPLVFESGKGYQIMQEYYLPPLRLSTEEAQALVLISSLSRKYTDRRIAGNIETAMEKIRVALSGRVRETAEQLSEQIRVYVPEGPPDRNNRLDEIRNAIIEKTRLKIEYWDNFEKKTVREIEPIGLTFYSNQWHAIAWCHYRNAYRDFKVLQIKRLGHTGEPFRIKDHLSLNDYIRTLEKISPEH